MRWNARIRGGEGVWARVWRCAACGLGALALAGLLPGPLGADDALARGKKAKSAARSTANAPPPIATSGEGDDSSPDAAPTASGETLDNAAVIRLAQAGLGESTVAAMVRNTRGHYDISTPALVVLTRAGVPSGAIAAMIKVARTAEAAEVHPDSPDPKAPHPAGVYVLARWLPQAKMLAIRPTTTTRTTSGSVLGYAYAGGLIPVSYRAILPQPHAAILAGESRPTFYFYTAAETGSQHLATVWGAAPDTAEISLVRFAVTHNGREVKIGSFSIRGANIGVDGKDALPFDIKEPAPGVVAVQPQIDLKPGEYGFVQTAAGVGTGAAMASTTSARVFDFAVADGAAISRGELSHESGGGSAEQVQGTTTGVMVRIPGAGFRMGTTKQPKPKPLPNSSPSLYP